MRHFQNHNLGLHKVITSQPAYKEYPSLPRIIRLTNILSEKWSDASSKKNLSLKFRTQVFIYLPRTKHPWATFQHKPSFTKSTLRSVVQVALSQLLQLTSRNICTSVMEDCYSTDSIPTAFTLMKSQRLCQNSNRTIRRMTLTRRLELKISH